MYHPKSLSFFDLVGCFVPLFSFLFFHFLLFLVGEGVGLFPSCLGNKKCMSHSQTDVCRQLCFYTVVETADQSFVLFSLNTLTPGQLVTTYYTHLAW